jgi:sugar-specific transcriptional regulator TrmB
MGELEKLLKFTGLAKYESSALKALFDLRESTVENLAKKSAVPLPKLYETLKILERKGFVSSSLDRPVRYRLVSPEISFAKHLEVREQKLEGAKRGLKSVSKEFYETKKQAIEQTYILRNRGFVLDFLKENLEKNTQNSCFACIAFKFSHTPSMPVMKRKIRQGLDCRIIGVLPPGNEYIAEKYVQLGAKVKVLAKEIAPFRFNVFDKKYVSATILDEPEEYLAIWSNKKQTVQTFLDLFNFYWSAGKNFK